MKKNTKTLNESKSGRLWSWLSRMVKPKPKTMRFNPAIQGFHPAIFSSELERFMPETVIGKQFKGLDGNKWEVISFVQSEDRDVLSADGVMTIQSV